MHSRDPKVTDTVRMAVTCSHVTKPCSRKKMFSIVPYMFRTNHLFFSLSHFRLNFDITNTIRFKNVSSCCHDRWRDWPFNHNVVLLLKNVNDIYTRINIEYMYSKNRFYVKSGMSPQQMIIRITLKLLRNMVDMWEISGDPFLFIQTILNYMYKKNEICKEKVFWKLPFGQGVNIDKYNKTL